MTLLVLATAVACISWTVTHEGIFEEWRNHCKQKAGDPKLPLLKRKCHYVWTCEYCFSHWVALLSLLATGYRLPNVAPGAEGFFLTLFAVIAVSNVMMSGWFIVKLFTRWLGAQSK